MKKRLISLGVVLTLAFMCCFGGVAFATQDIQNTDWQINPGGSVRWSTQYYSDAYKYTAGIPAVHRITEWIHVPEVTGVNVNRTYSAVYRNSQSNRVSDGYVIFTGAARKTIPYLSGYGGTGWGYMLKTQSGGDSINQYYIYGSWAPDHQ